jgi:hypothetical protein
LLIRITQGNKIYNIIYLLTAIGLSPGSSKHLHTNNTQNNTNNNRTTQITKNVEECGPCPVFASFYPGICLTTEEKSRKTEEKARKVRKKHGKLRKKHRSSTKLKIVMFSHK